MNKLITVNESVDHLLSATRCSKHFFVAFFLNLHQITDPLHLLQMLSKKLFWIIPHLVHMDQQHTQSSLELKKCPSNHSCNSIDFLPLDCQPCNMSDVQSNMPSTTKTTSKHKCNAKQVYCILVIKHMLDLLYHWICYYPSDFANEILLEMLKKCVHNKLKNKTMHHRSIKRRWKRLEIILKENKPLMKYQSIFESSVSSLRIPPEIEKSSHKISFQFSNICIQCKCILMQ